MLDKKKSKISFGISFGMTYHSTISMLSPITFMNTHKSIPEFSKLSKDVQKHLSKMENEIEIFQNYFDSKLRERYEELLERDNHSGIEKIVEEINNLYDTFMSSLDELKKFKEVYPE